jgi:hypothetical protein
MGKIGNVNHGLKTGLSQRSQRKPLLSLRLNENPGAEICRGEIAGDAEKVKVFQYQLPRNA